MAYIVTLDKADTVLIILKHQICSQKKDTFQRQELSYCVSKETNIIPLWYIF